MAPFRLQHPKIDPRKASVIRLKPSYYQILVALKAKTGIPLGTIAEQCIDYALDNMEGDVVDAQ